MTDIQFLTHDVTDQRERELQQEDALRFALTSAEHANKAKRVPVGDGGFWLFLTSQDKNWEGEKSQKTPSPLV